MNHDHQQSSVMIIVAFFTAFNNIFFCFSCQRLITATVTEKSSVFPAGATSQPSAPFLSGLLSITIWQLKVRSFYKRGHLFPLCKTVYFFILCKLLIKFSARSMDKLALTEIVRSLTPAIAKLDGNMLDDVICIGHSILWRHVWNLMA